MKNLLIKLGLWEEKGSMWGLSPDDILFMQNARKHYCGICERWFEKVQGKLMHDRHRHKDETGSNQPSA